MSDDPDPIPTIVCPHCRGSGLVVDDPNTTLRDLRRRVGLGQSKIARALGVSQAYISDVENGARGITPDRTIQWIRACGLPTPWLTTEEGEEEKS